MDKPPAPTILSRRRPEAARLHRVGTSAATALGSALGSALIAGCALVSPKEPLDTAALRDQSMEVVVKAPPNFYADNSARRMFGFVGLFVMAHEGNRIVRHYNLADPSLALAESLRLSIARASVHAESRKSVSASASTSAATAAMATPPAATTQVLQASPLHASGESADGLSGADGSTIVSLAAPRTGASRATASGSGVPVAEGLRSATTANKAAESLAPIPVVPGDPGATRPDLTLKVQTTNWEYRPFQGNDDQYYVIYAARVELYDNHSGRLLARERCEVTPTVDAKLTEDELLADGASKLRAELGAASGMCLAMLRAKPLAALLGLSPLIAHR